MKLDANNGDRGWVYDADGVLVALPFESADTETGECVVYGTDGAGRLILNAEQTDVVRVPMRLKAPLTVAPELRGGRTPPSRILPGATPCPTT